MVTKAKPPSAAAAATVTEAVSPPPAVGAASGAQASSTRRKAPNRRKSPARLVKSKSTNKALGRIGEDLSCVYLKQHDYKILERNWRCKSGEADIIAYEGDTLVFVEVKTRSQTSCGLPEDAVTAKKRQRYEGIAINYLTRHSFPSSKVRFDVISITVFNELKAFLRHHRDAFASGE
jgi:putative endonuclease